MIYNGTHVLIRFCAFLGYAGTLRTYSSISRPSVPGLELDPAIDFRICQELGDFAVCDHFRLWFMENAHVNGVSDKSSDGIFCKASFFRNLVKGDVPSSRYHIRDFVAAYSVDGDQILDL